LNFEGKRQTKEPIPGERGPMGKEETEKGRVFRKPAKRGRVSKTTT